MQCKVTSNRTGSFDNTGMLIRGCMRTTQCHIESSTQEALGWDSPILPCLVEHAGCILSTVQRDRDGKTRCETLHGEKRSQEVVPFGERVLAKQISTDPMHSMNPRYKSRISFGKRSNSADYFMENADGVKALDGGYQERALFILIPPKKCRFLDHCICTHATGSQLPEHERAHLTWRPPVAECRIETTCLRPNVLTGHPDTTGSKTLQVEAQ